MFTLKPADQIDFDLAIKDCINGKIDTITNLFIDKCKLMAKLDEQQPYEDMRDELKSECEELMDDICELNDEIDCLKLQVDEWEDDYERAEGIIDDLECQLEQLEQL